MVLAAPAKSQASFKINTEITQAASIRVPQRAQPARTASRGTRGTRGTGRVAGESRESARDPGRVVVEVGLGIVVYPPEVAGGLWRAVFTENGRRRYRQARSEAQLAARLEKKWRFLNN